MNSKLLLLAVAVAAFGSCTTLYKSGQTPDDVYFSPARPDAGEGYVDQRREESRQPQNVYASEYRTIRLGITDPRWRYLDYGYSNYSSDFYLNDYSYSPYNYGYNYGYYYNPFYYPYPVYGGPVYGGGSVSGKPSTATRITTPRMTNLSSYNPVYNNSSIRPSANGMAARSNRTYNNSNRGSAVGNVMKQIFTPSNSNTNNSNNSLNRSSSNTRTYSPPASSTPASSGSSSSGGGISRPPRN